MQARALTTLLALALGMTLATASPALADDTPLPVVAPDTVTLYAGQMTDIDVIANDTSPTGDDLAVCRFPEYDDQSVWVEPMDDDYLMVMAMPDARGTHTIDYFVCDHTHLVPATLTVVIREVEPVDVVKTDRPGRLRVTNHNTKPIRFWFGHPEAPRPDGRLRIDAGETTTVRVQRHMIVWIALIGGRPVKGGLSSPAIADMGYVRHIKLRGAPLPLPHGSVGPDGSLEKPADLVARWR